MDLHNLKDSAISISASGSNTPSCTAYMPGVACFIWIHTVDGQIIQTPHPWVVGYPLSPQISTLWFRIFVPDLRVWFISSIRRSEPNQKNNIVIGGAGGYWITRVWIIRPSTVVSWTNYWRGTIFQPSLVSLITSGHQTWQWKMADL